MQWVSAFIDSVSAVLGGDRPARRPPSGGEAARLALLELLDSQPDAPVARLRQRIMGTQHPDVLWLLRADIVQHLTRTCGEAAARERVLALNPLWEGRVSRGYLDAQHRHGRMMARLASCPVASVGDPSGLPSVMAGTPIRTARRRHLRFSSGG